MVIIKRQQDLRWSDVTPRDHYLRRREFIQAAAVAVAGGVAAFVSPSDAFAQGKGAKLPNVKKSEWGQGETPTSYDAVTTYNNFYELGVDKNNPSRNAASSQAAAVDGDRSRAWSPSPGSTPSMIS